MTVTVSAAPGAFPTNAVLSVKLVPVYEQEQADAAIEEVRDGDANVAVSYTFDIKVVDPETGEEFQPAEGFDVEVSFALAEAADENLETNVYHVTDEGGDMTVEKLEAEAVSVSNADLFFASNETGKWMVHARQPFSTTEWMAVTINGVSYQITVTDDETTITYIARYWDYKLNEIGITSYYFNNPIFDLLKLVTCQV